MDARPRQALERALGVRVETASPVAGGDINEAWEVRLADGRTVFAKTHARADPAMFPAEARGLEWLRAAGALRIPEVLAAEAEVLALERIDSAPRRAGFDDELGRGLAALHRFGAPSFGVDHDNFIGRLPQPNAPLPSWSEFYRERRLGAQLRAARRAGLADAALERDFDRLFARLPDLVGPEEPPARLHGDLWGGNLHVDEHGAPCLIDPAVYGGHREVDLAMMRLFGGFSPRVFAAYEEAYPLAPGAADRVALYQLYPLLVHVNLFGGGYVGSVRRSLGHYV
jgi:fructosamine-3-kinase